MQNIEPVDRIGRRAWGDSAKAVSERLRQAAPGLYFRCYKAWFYKTKYDREPAHQDDPNLRSLRQDGICVIPDFLNPEEVGTILQEAGEALRELEEFQDTRLGKATCMPSSGIYRLDDVERLAPASARFFSDPVIWRVARAFVSRTVTSRKRMLELRPPIEAQAITDTVHFDDWRIKFKAFLYLVDVDEGTAPLRYFKGSHRCDEAWRTRKELEFFRYGTKGPLGYFSDQELSAYRIRSRFEEWIVTARAGTLILVDTRGLHSGRPARTGRRLLLANYFEVGD